MELAKKRQGILLACAAILLTSAAYAQDEAGTTTQKANRVTLLDRLVVGAGAEKVAIDTPQAVTVLDQEDLDRQQASTTGELFDAVPGVNIVGSNRQLGEAFNIRGIGTTENSSDGSRIIVNVDGMPKFYEQYRMGSFFSDPELYKQVEVLRGPASSTLYGAGAIGGVINFTTKDASDFIEPGKNGVLKLKETFNSNGSGTTTSATIAQRINESFEVLATGNWRRSNEMTQANGAPLEGSNFNGLSGLVKGTAHFGENNEQTLKASYQHWHSGADQMPYAATGVISGIGFGYTDRYVTDKTAVIAWSNPATDNPWLNANVSFSYSDTLNQQRNHRATPNGPLTGDAPPSTFADTDYGYRTFQLKGDNTIEWIGQGFENYLTFGLQASSQDRTVFFPDGDVDVTTHPEGTERRGGLFAQNEFIWDERLTLIGGMRIDGHQITASTPGLADRDGYALSPKVAAHYAISDNVSIFGSLAHTERLPTIDELYSSGRGKTTSLNLRKEKANSFEAGISFSNYDIFTEGDTTAIKTTAFYNHITDMIASNTGTGVPYYGNVAEAELYGVEIEAAYDSDYVFGNLAYTFTIGNDLTTNQPLTTVPQNKLVATIGARKSEWNLEVGAQLTFADVGRYIVPAVGSRGPQADGTAEAWNTANLYASWKPEDGALAGTEMRFSVDNLFNVDYRPNLAANRSTGRTFKLTFAKQIGW